MGNTLRKGNYSYELDQYSKVPLTSLSDDSDDEDVIYGHKVDNGKIELQLIPPQNGKPPVNRPKHQPKVIQPDPKNWTVFCWVTCILITCIVIAAVGALKLSAYNNTDNKNVNSTGILNNHTNHVISPQQSKPNIISVIKPPTKGNIKHPIGKDWKKKMENYGSESCVRLIDVDNDGVLDIIFGASLSENIGEGLQKLHTSAEEICKMKHMSYPCLGHLFAIRGTDGEVLWKTFTKSAVIFINCEDFDVNKDGQKDCIVTGRRATLQAVNPKNGKILWLGDNNLIKPTWNTYQVLALPDFDQDGVPEVLVTNGGDPDKDPEEHNRHSGRLLVLSGATGKVFGMRYLAAPNKKEIYMSPVMYTTKDGSQYILFGTGGETIPGDLLMISVPDLYHYVTDTSHSSVVPGINGESSYDYWQNRIKDDATGLITVVRGKNKGYMVPPVIVDVNKDGVDDVLASGYDGTITLISGQDLTEIWSAHFPGMESYTSPSPGYFNDDETLDFIVHWSVGAWPQYTLTQNYIIDGRDGSRILTMNSSQYQMSSDLTLHTTQNNRDLFIFKVRGRGSHITMDRDSGLHGLDRIDKGPSPAHILDAHSKSGNNVLGNGDHGPIGNPPKDRPGRIKRHGPEGEQHRVPEEHHYLNEEALKLVFSDYSSRHFLCSDDVDIKSEILLMDRTTINNPVRIIETGTENYNYSVPRHANETDTANITMCIVIMPDDRTTAAVGDVDGDGLLDIVSLVGMSGETVDSGYSYRSSVYWTYVKKVTLSNSIADKSHRVPATIKSTVTPNPQDKDMADIDILPLSQQKWTQYMGSKGDSYYGRS